MPEQQALKPGIKFQDFSMPLLLITMGLQGLENKYIFAYKFGVSTSKHQGRDACQTFWEKRMNNKVQNSAKAGLCYPFFGQKIWHVSPPTVDALA